MVDSSLWCLHNTNSDAHPPSEVREASISTPTPCEPIGWVSNELDGGRRKTPPSVRAGSTSSSGLHLHRELVGHPTDKLAQGVGVQEVVPRMTATGEARSTAREQGSATSPPVFEERILLELFEPIHDSADNACIVVCIAMTQSQGLFLTHHYDIHIAALQRSWRHDSPCHQRTNDRTWTKTLAE